MVSAPATCEIHIREFEPDFNDLAEPCVNRVNRIWRQEYPFYLFANPLVVITARHPSTAQENAVRASQKRWMNQSRNLLGRFGTRNPRNWVNIPCQPEKHKENILHFSGGTTKYERFIGRSICYIGVLFHRGKLVHPSRWPEILTNGPLLDSVSG